MKRSILFIFILFLSACSTHISNISIVSTKNVNFKNLDLTKYPKTQMVEGNDLRFIFGFIPFGFSSIQNAVDDALLKGNGNIMIDAELTYNKWWFIVGQNGYKIKGTVINVIDEVK